MTTTTLPPTVLAALTDPNVCGWLDETGPCDNCTSRAARQLADGKSEVDVLADIEQARLRGVELRMAANADARVPPCGMTHAEHMAAWRSWRDDCVDQETGCGFAVRDLDQCERGHPDDGVECCGACGHDITGRLTCPDHHVRMVARANGCWHCPAEGCLSAFHTSDCLPA